MDNNIYMSLKQITFALIDADIANGLELSFGDIGKYIDRACAIMPADEDIRKKVFTETEYKYKITHASANAIFDEYDDRVDWYSNEDIEEPFFWNRYKTLLVNNPSFSPQSISLLDQETLPNIMNCLGNPKEKLTKPRFNKGLIIGDVQSGKTATYTGLICKAADAGYKVVILLAGITESLRKQTQARIDEGIIGMTTKKIGKQAVSYQVGVGKDNQGIRATSFTSCVKDFTGDHNKIAMSLNSQNSLVVFVIKKNVSVLAKLYKWLKDFNLDPVKNCVDVPMLLIDDEADNASVNTKKDETDPTKTNRLIRQICNLFKDTTYVGFTATPFANVFIDPDSVDSMKNADLFPEHFIYALEPPSNYVGAHKIFYKDAPYYRNLRYITDIEEPDYTSEEYRDMVKDDIETLNSGGFYYRHKKEWDGELPASLDDAVLAFYLANAIRDLRPGQSASPRSMLVNMSRFINVQRIITDHVTDFHNKVLNDIRINFDEDPVNNSAVPLFKKFKEIWDVHFSHVEDISFERVIDKMTLYNAIDKIKVMMVNGSKQSDALDYSNNKSLRVIAIGGLALSRGLTLEGLMISYFYRNTATFDVLMQMGRWFGYRRGYEDLFQIWTSQSSADWYAEVAQSSQELKNSIKEMSEQRLTPKDFGIKVRDNCSELQITAANKMRTAIGLDLRFSFYSDIHDTPYVSFNVEHNRINLKESEAFIQSLFKAGYKFQYADIVKKSGKNAFDPNDHSSRLFADVPKPAVVSFLEKIKCSMANGNFNVPSLIEFINAPENVGLDYWDVVVEGGESEQNVGIKGLEFIKCAKRAIYYGTKNVVQISSRRRALSGSQEGRYGLTEKQIEKAAASHGGKNTPLKAYFKHVEDRKPILIILPIFPIPAETDPGKKEYKKLQTFREELRDDNLIAFAAGFPGIKGIESTVHYKVNKIYQQLNIEDFEEEEVDDAE